MILRTWHDKCGSTISHQSLHHTTDQFQFINGLKKRKLTCSIVYITVYKESGPRAANIVFQKSLETLRSA